MVFYRIFHFLFACMINDHDFLTTDYKCVTLELFSNFHIGLTIMTYYRKFYSTNK